MLRALYEWIVDNDCTPYILVDANHANVKVPPGYAADGQIVLNAAPAAVRDFTMDNQAVSFEARFSGAPFSLYVPITAVLAIYARENGQGMFFDAQSDLLSDDDSVLEDEADLTSEPSVGLHAVPLDAAKDTADSTDDEPPSPPSGGRPSLRVVK
jgi:stringent starvation protein B